MLSYELNTAILDKVKRLGLVYSVSDNAPGNFESLVKQPGLVVWSGASDTTIYGDPLVNYAFRAWHDNCHKVLGLDFSTQSERIIARYQANQLPGNLADLIHAEVAGQTEYYEKHGFFPLDQINFVLSQVKGIYARKK